MKQWKDENEQSHISFTWEERLDHLYNIVSCGGLTCPERAASEFHGWIKSKYGRDTEVHFEAIPDEDWAEFEAYVYEEDEE